MAGMINTTDDRGRTVWITTSRSDFDQYLPGIRENGERYRIVERPVRSMGGRSRLFVLTIWREEVATVKIATHGAGDPCEGSGRVLKRAIVNELASVRVDGAWVRRYRDRVRCPACRQSVPFERLGEGGDQ